MFHRTLTPTRTGRGSQHLRRSALAALTAAMALLSAAAPTAGATTQLFAATNTAGAHLAMNLNMFSGEQIPNSTVATTIASTHDVIVAGAAQQIGGYTARMRQVNPDLTILAYDVGMLSPYSGYPESWYMHDKTGARIRTKIGDQFLMNPQSTKSYRTYAGWTDLVRHRCTAAIHASPGVFNSCWIDMLGTAPLWSGYNVGGAV